MAFIYTRSKPEVMTTVEKAAREQHVDQSFMAVLRRLLGQNQDIAPGKTSTNSAVKAMRGCAETTGIRDDELFDTQQRLLDANDIVIKGSPHRISSDEEAGLVGDNVRRRDWCAKVEK